MQDLAAGLLAHGVGYSTFADGDSLVLGLISPAIPNRSSKLAM
jgi:hypothetical protein